MSPEGNCAPTPLCLGRTRWFLPPLRPRLHANFVPFRPMPPCRPAARSPPLQTTVSPAPPRAAEDAGDAEASLRAVWELAARRDLVGAATVALTSKNMFLGSLLAQAGSSPDFTLLVGAQLDEWSRGCVACAHASVWLPCVCRWFVCVCLYP
jgi:hypothetical protein